MDTQTTLPTQSDDTVNAATNTGSADQPTPLTNEDLMPFYFLAIAGSY
jgi:hypothetical protein